MWSDMELEIRLKKRAVMEEIAIYSGDDPLGLHFEFLEWMDAKYGRKNCDSEYRDFLNSTLNLFFEEPGYSQDPRLIRLLSFYAQMLSSPLGFYKTLVDKEIGTQCSVFYEYWSVELFRIGDYKEIDRIIKLGISKKAQPLEQMTSLQSQLYESLGQKYLAGELQTSNNIKNQLCSKCAQLSQTDECGMKPKRFDIGDIFDWNLNPLKVGDPDDFTCPVAYFITHDANQIASYPKSLVYSNGKEYSLEELKALRFFDKANISSNINLNKGPIEDVDHSLSTKDKSAFLSSSRSCGELTKEAFNMVQELWNSPSSNASKRLWPPVESSAKSNIEKPDSPIVCIQPRKTTQFTVYQDSAMDDFSANISPQKPQKPHEIDASSHLIPDCVDSGNTFRSDPNGPMPNAIVENKKSSVNMDDSLREDKNADPMHEKMISSVLTKTLEATELKKMQDVAKTNSLQHKAQIGVTQPPLAPISSLFSAEERLLLKNGLTDDAKGFDETYIVNTKKVTPSKKMPNEVQNDEDDTCNTKAFAFLLPSSTPIHKKIANQDQKHGPSNIGTSFHE